MQKWRPKLPNPQTLFGKIWDDHIIADLSVDKDGSAALIAIDRIFLHERTGAAALSSLANAGRVPLDPSRIFAVMDHIVDTRIGRSDRTMMQGGQAFITETRDACKKAGITLFDIGDEEQGITHVISPELGIVLPGCTIIAPDSHTCTQGAFGALAWGIGSSEAEHAMATGTLRVARPKTMRVHFNGELARGVGAKDMILYLIAQYGAGGGSGYAIEFCGNAVTNLDMEGRMTLCNMATEFAAFTGMIAPDEKTINYLRGRRYAPTNLPDWGYLKSDEGAVFDKEIHINSTDISPMISWGTSPQHSIAAHDIIPENAPQSALKYMGLKSGQSILGLPINVAFIGSCTNARITDLRRAAAIISGKKIAGGVCALVVPGSTQVKKIAEAEGLDKIFTDAGFEWRESGCSLCFYAGGESFPEGSRVISSTNRNFEGRQGPNIQTHIASPDIVAASAIAGRIALP
ncbi:3-isopropylmalate dehydratase [Sphingorhabdus lutea]|uniref:3-isopropylmalate dehydratase n=1 Tax=Sphingorhabdus lutea TaxID=1913578 RepID=A0A1L3J969_9SPHN|nr:3-isopropylmalate dehydratase large subunit [Sphingorhabdus lutea]APG61667.1 3-isopropylmalate dehydratase [Sphingorhabdus lutea]